jgi:hypothetical protein
MTTEDRDLVSVPDTACATDEARDKAVGGDVQSHCDCAAIDNE